jgi:hypothetical protein
MTDITPEALISAGFHLQPQLAGDPVRRYYAPIGDGPAAGNDSRLGVAFGEQAPGDFAVSLVTPDNGYEFRYGFRHVRTVEDLLELHRLLTGTSRPDEAAPQLQRELDLTALAIAADVTTEDVAAACARRGLDLDSANLDAIPRAVIEDYPPQPIPPATG